MLLTLAMVNEETRLKSGDEKEGRNNRVVVNIK